MGIEGKLVGGLVPSVETHPALTSAGLEQGRGATDWGRMTANDERREAELSDCNPYPLSPLGPTRRRVVAALATVASAGSLASILVGCAYPQSSFRYRMIVEVMVDGVVRIGSSVMELRLWRELSDKGWRDSISSRGKYPIVDLGGKGWLIASNVPTFVTDTPPGFRRKGQSPYRNPYAMPFRDLHAKLPRVEVPEPLLPRFIWVPPDTNLVDTKQLQAWDIEKVAGSGVRLIQVIVEPTSDPLGWPPDFKEPEWVKPVLARKTIPRPQFPRPREGDWALQPYNIERE